MKVDAVTSSRKLFAARCCDIGLWLCVLAAVVFVVLMVAAFTPVP